MFVDVVDQETVILTLLIDAGKIGFADEAGNALSGGIGGGGEGAEGGSIEGLSISAFTDDEAAFIEDEGGSGLAFADQIFKGGVEAPDVLFKQLRERGHN